MRLFRLVGLFLVRYLGFVWNIIDKDILWFIFIFLKFGI